MAACLLKGRWDNVASILGDSGKTRTLSGQIVDKDDLIIQVNGAIDELSSLLGWAGLVQTDEFRGYLRVVQEHLVILGAEISAGGQGVSIINEEQMLYLSELMEKLDRMLPSLKEFILPGQTEASVRIHLARCAARRTEVLMVSLNKEKGIRAKALAYINRLSDLLFVMARYADENPFN
jgi:cob(I)alamin adenosyltransferase